MAVQATYPIGLTSVVNEFNPTFTPRGVIISNYSADNLAFDNTVDPILLIPPGVRAPIVIGHYVSTLRVRSASNTTGAASITIMDSQPDMTGAPNLQQLPGTITAKIPSTITTIPDPTGLQNTSDTTAQGLLTQLQTLLTTLNTLTTDLKSLMATVNSNTGGLLGLLPTTIVTLTYANTSGGPASEQTITLTGAIDGFALAVQPAANNILNVPASDGLLWAWYEVGGSRVYVVARAYFAGPRATLQPPQTPNWMAFHDAVPAGGKLGVGFEGTGTVLVKL